MTMAENDPFGSAPDEPTPSLQDALLQKKKKAGGGIMDTVRNALTLHDPRLNSIAPSTRDYTLPGGPDTGLPVPINSPMGRTLMRGEGLHPKGNSPSEDWLSDTLGEVGSTIDTIADPKASTAQKLLAPGDFLRYGVTPQQKNDLTEKGMIPGMREAVGEAIDPKTGESTADATRYASNYLAAKQGHLPLPLVAAGNAIALSDIPDLVGMGGWKGLKAALARKAAGARGMVKGMQDTDHPLLNALSSVLGSPR